MILKKMELVEADGTASGDDTVHIRISDDLVRGRNKKEIQKAVYEGLLVRDYIKAEISIGKFAALMGMSYEEGRDWLHKHGIATLRKFTDPELEKAEKENFRLLEKRLEREGSGFLDELGNFPTDKDLPEDLSSQHDHYLYGIPKKP
jgi:hypothetical protein